MNDTHAAVAEVEVPWPPFSHYLLEFLQDREGIDHPLHEVARNFALPESTIIEGCRSLYWQREKVMVSVAAPSGLPVLLDVPKDLSDYDKLRDFFSAHEAGQRHDTRVVAAVLDWDEETVLTALRELSRWESGLVDVYVRAEVDPSRPRARFINPFA